MKATRKLIGALAALVIAIAVATGSTFAWFTSNQNVSMEGLDLTVTSGTDGLYMAVKGHDGNYGTFKKTIEPKEIYNAVSGVDTGFTNVDLDAVTSEKGATMTDEKGTEVTFDKDLTADSNKKNQFVEFTVKFRSTVEQGVFLYSDSAINDSGSVTLTPVKAWKEISAGTYDDSTEAILLGGSLAARASNAARVSFGEDKIWSPNEATSDSVIGNGKGYWKGNLARDYKNFFTNETENYDSPKGTFTSVAAGSDYDASKAVVVLTEDATSKLIESEVTIRIWLEGKDGDCLNSIFNDHFAITLNFVGVRSSAKVPTL